MTNIIIILLLLVLIFKDEIKDFKRKPIKPEVNEEEEKKQKELKTQFDNLMAYSIEDAIESKKVD